MMTVAQQASAIEAASRIISGAAIKPSAKERAYIQEQMDDALRTLRWVEANADRIRELMKATPKDAAA